MFGSTNQDNKSFVLRGVHDTVFEQVRCASDGRYRAHAPQRPIPEFGKDEVLIEVSKTVS